MINLHIDDVSEHLVTDIIPYQWSIEELMDIIEDQQGEIDILAFDSFFDRTLQELTGYQNIFAAQEYIDKYGVDDRFKELIGEEGFVETIGKAIVKFAQWIWKVLSNIAKWIYNLFTGNSNTPTSIPKGSSPKEKAASINQRLHYDKRAVVDSAVKDLSETAKLYNDKEQIEFDSDLYPIYEAVHSFFRDIESDTAQIDWNEWFKTYKETFNDQQRYGERIIELASSKGKHKYRAKDACYFIEKLSFSAFGLRSLALAIAESIKRLPKLSTSPSEEEATKYVETIVKTYQIDLPKGHMSDKNAFIDTFRKFLIGWRKTLALFLRIDRVLTTSVIRPSVNTLCVVANPRIQNSNEKFNGGVDVRVPVPAGLKSRFAKLWGNLVSIKRVIVTNTRLTSELGIKKRSSGTFGLSVSISMTTNTNKVFPITSYEVVLNYNLFRDKLCMKDLQGRMQQNLEDEGISPKESKKIHAAITDDRILEFFRTLIHEIRHVWQTENKKNMNKREELEKVESYRDYLFLTAESDARKAADEFLSTITEEDKNWVRSILLRCLKQERDNINATRRKLNEK